MIFKSDHREWFLKEFILKHEKAKSLIRCLSNLYVVIAWNCDRKKGDERFFGPTTAYELKHFKRCVIGFVVLYPCKHTESVVYIDLVESLLAKGSGVLKKIDSVLSYKRHNGLPYHHWIPEDHLPILYARETMNEAVKKFCFQQAMIYDELFIEFLKKEILYNKEIHYEEGKDYACELLRQVEKDFADDSEENDEKKIVKKIKSG